jgi:hypothetical protein
MLPPPGEALVHGPTWVRGQGPSYHDAEPVSLVMALEEEPAASHVEMIATHVEVLVGWTEIGDDMVATKDPEAIERKAVGFALLMFTAELASALGSPRFAPVVSHELRADAHEAVTRATLLAGACLAATVSEYLASVA